MCLPNRKQHEGMRLDDASCNIGNAQLGIAFFPVRGESVQQSASMTVAIVERGRSCHGEMFEARVVTGFISECLVG